MPQVSNLVALNSPNFHCSQHQTLKSLQNRYRFLAVVSRVLQAFFSFLWGCFKGCSLGCFWVAEVHNKCLRECYTGVSGISGHFRGVNIAVKKG